MKNSKNKFFMIGIVIFCAWIAIEAYFHSIAVDAQKNYTDDLLQEVQEYYDEIENIHNLSKSVGTLYVKKNNEFILADTNLLISTLLKKYHKNGFIYSVEAVKQDPSEYTYKLDKEKKRLKYTYGYIVIDMDATHYFERIRSVWLKFFFVSFFFTAFIFALIFLIRFLAKQSMNYKQLSNTLELKVKQQTKQLEQEHVKKEIYLETLFDKSPNIIIISTGKNIIRANKAFFNFFTEYDSLEAFKQEHNCICEFFCTSKYKDTILGEETQWVKDVLSAKEPIVKICYLEQEYYFSIYANKIYEENTMHLMITFNDITDMYKIRHKFEELSMQDALTHIYNRRYFNTVFPRELNRAKRAHESFCFAIMDVDHFKLYNDNYGHDGGDIVLKKLTAKIEELTQRSNEFFFRLGGEEFGFLSSALSKEEVLQNINNMCKAVENLEIEHLYNNASKCVTVSIGVCFLQDPSHCDTKTIYKKADEALYKAKDKGRNRVVLVEEC